MAQHTNVEEDYLQCTKGRSLKASPQGIQPYALRNAWRDLGEKPKKEGEKARKRGRVGATKSKGRKVEKGYRKEKPAKAMALPSARVLATLKLDHKSMA